VLTFLVFAHLARAYYSFKVEIPIYFVEYDIYYSHTFNLKIPTFAFQLCNVTGHLIPLFFKSNALDVVVHVILQTGNTSCSIRN
jgi:hypothetical protein